MPPHAETNDPTYEAGSCAPRQWTRPREGTTRLSTLLAAPAPPADATSVILIGDDGYRQNPPLATVRVTDALVVTAPDGSRRAIFPRERPRQWIKGLARIEIG